MRKLLCSTAIALQLASTLVAIPYNEATAATHRVHKLRSPHFIVAALDHRGIKVLDMRRLAQVYFLHVADGFGTEALMAVDGYSSEIIGLVVLKLGKGVTAIAGGSRGRHFVDLGYSFGYTIEWSVYESYTVITTEEISVTEEYVEVTYEETEEVVYEEVEEYVEADLDEGAVEDASGDRLAEDVVDDVDDGFVDTSDDQQADDAGQPDDADDHDQGQVDDGQDEQVDDGGADDGDVDDGGADDDAADDGGADEYGGEEVIDEGDAG